MTKRDYYDTLGVNQSDSADVIKQAYRRLAMKYHPDRNTSDPTSAEEKFKEIQEAYSCLSDESKREMYDRFGHDAFTTNGSGGAEHQGDFSSIFGDVFSSFFGGGGGSSQQRRGKRRILDVDLSFEEMVDGCEKVIRLSLPTTCQSCRGSGAKPGTKPKVCKTCSGQGQVRTQRGAFTLQQTCPYCRGEGRVIGEACTNCQGKGEIVKEKSLSVNIPAGIDDDDLLRVNAGNNEEIYLRMSVEKHPLFKRESSNLHVEIPISMAMAALGGEIEIPSIRGSRLFVKVPAGLQSGQRLRVTEEGLPNVKTGRRGHIFCHIHIEIPVNLSGKQKKLLQELDDSFKEQHIPKGKSWLEKVKNLFVE